MTAGRLPLSVKIPAVVIVFMAAVAVFVSERVLTRLAEAQTRHLGDLATVYLDGLASALAGPVVREDVWEVFDILDRAGRTDALLKPTQTVVADAGGRVVAASDPRAVPSWSTLPAPLRAVPQGGTRIAERAGTTLTDARREISSGGTLVGSVYATFDIAPLLAERRSVLVALVATNALLTLILAATAWLTVTRMMRPLGVLSAHLRAGAAIRIEPIPAATVEAAPPEFRRLFGAFNEMAGAVREREALSRRLADEERLASLGRLASGMAHEINNPLGGLFNAIDTLKAHGARTDVRQRTLALIERGLKGIRDVVRATLVTYRTDGDARALKAADLDDLRLLVAPEIGRKRLVLDWCNAGYDEVAAPASAVRQIVLNLLLNACAATPEGGTVAVEARVEGRRLVVTIADAGTGMSASARAVLLGPEADAPAGGGLGLWLVRRLVREIAGTISVDAAEPTGTLVRVTVPLATEEALADVA